MKKRNVPRALNPWVLFTCWVIFAVTSIYIFLVGTTFVDVIGYEFSMKLYFGVASFFMVAGGLCAVLLLLQLNGHFPKE